MLARPVIAAALVSAAFGLQASDSSAAVSAFSLSGPANGAFVNGTPTLAWGASTGATSYTLTITPASGAPLVKSNLTSTSYTIAAGEALSEAGGPYTWRVTARDDGGTTIDSSNTWSFFVDTTPPSAFGLTAPEADVFARDQSVRFTWDPAVDSGSGLSKYHFFIDGALCGDATGAGFAFLPSTCNPTDGTHTWAVSAEDGAGNIRWCNEAPGGSGGRVIRIDNTGPGAKNADSSYAIASANIPDQYGIPTDRMVNTGINVLPGDSISVTSTGTWCFLSCTLGCFDTNGHNDQVNIPTQDCNNGALIARIGGGTRFHCVGKSATFTADFDESGILELGSNASTGCPDATVTATVAGGRLFNLVSPAAGAILNQQFPTFSWEAAPDEGAGGVTYLLYIDNTAVGETITSIGTSIAGTSFTVSDRLGDGAHTWRVRARDAAGNVTDSTTRSFTVDTTPPEQFRLKSPTSGTCSVTPTPSFCWNAPTDAGGLARYELWIDGALASSVDAPATCASPSAALTPGNHSWYVVAIDRVGNARRSIEQFSVLVDYTAPGAPSLMAPANGSSSPDPPMFTWGPAADAGGVARYEVYVDGTLGATVGGDTLSWLPPADPALGPHSWYVRAIDACGQSAQSVTGNFTTVSCTPDAAPHPCPGYNVGHCQPGTRTCTSPGTWSTCTGVVKPSIEICNGEDDDCDGVVDNGSNVNNPCGGICSLGIYLYTPCDGLDTDQCAEGVFLCTGLNAIECVETTPVETEICNGRDDDCNGVVDDGCTAPPVPDGGAPPDSGMQPDGGGPAGTSGETSTGTGGRLEDAGMREASRPDAASGATGGAGSSGGSGGGTSASGSSGAETAGDAGRGGLFEGGPGGADALTTDAARSDGGGGAGTTEGTTAADGAADAGLGAPVGTSASGCSCRLTTAASENPPSWMLVMGCLGLFGRRRRKSS